MHGVALMERMIADFDRTAADLDREIRVEQDRAGDPRPSPFRLSDLCQGSDRAPGQSPRRSADELRAQLAKANEALFGVGVAA